MKDSVGSGALDWRGFVRSQRTRVALSGVSVLVVLGLAFFAVQRLSIPDMLAAISSADGRWLLAAVALLAAGQALRAARWWRILNWEARPAGERAFQGLMGGQVLNWLLPIRLGEIWRIWHVNRTGANSLVWIGGGVVVEKSADSLALALMAAALAFLPLPANLPSAATRLLLLGLAGFFVAGGLVVFRSTNWPVKLLRRFPQLVQLAVAMQPTHAHAEQLRNPWNWIEAFALSVVIWAVAIITNMSVAQAFGIDLGIPAHLVLMLAIMGGIVLAGVPANAAFPLVVGGVMALFGVDSARAFAFATVLYALTYGVNLALAGASWGPALVRAVRSRAGSAPTA